MRTMHHRSRPSRPTDLQRPVLYWRIA